MTELQWNRVASPETLARTVAALEQNGMMAEIASSREDAKQRVVAKLVPGAQVMTMTSVTLEELGLVTEINDSGRYDSVKNQLRDMDRTTQFLAMQQLGAAPGVALGSVHAVTESGVLVIVSNTGSQLPAYAYGAAKVIFAVGAQKVVQDLEQAMQRIQEYTLPLESTRAQKAYGVPGSNISKVLIINKEVQVGRVSVVFVPENIGY